MPTFARFFTIFGIVLAGTVAGVAAPDASDDAGLSVSQRLAMPVDPAKLDHVPAKQAFEWWSHTSGVPLVINWDKMEKDGIDPATPINLDLRDVPAKELLDMMMQQASDQPLIYESTPWYVSITTKTEANRHMVLRTYDVGDLIHDSPPISNVPRLDLGSALSNTNMSSNAGTSGSTTSGNSSSGSNSGSSNGLFGQNSTNQQTTKVRSEDERTDELAKIIRDTIEPTIWTENGGQASIRSFRGHLIVNAPAYVQAQIGIPEPSHGPPQANPRYEVVMRPKEPVSKDVAGVATQKPAPVAGVMGK